MLPVLSLPFPMFSVDLLSQMTLGLHSFIVFRFRSVHLANMLVVISVLEKNNMLSRYCAEMFMKSCGVEKRTCFHIKQFMSYNSTSKSSNLDAETAKAVSSYYFQSTIDVASSKVCDY